MRMLYFDFGGNRGSTDNVWINVGGVLHSGGRVRCPGGWNEDYHRVVIPAVTEFSW
jgi:hypothetical protein